MMRKIVLTFFTVMLSIVAVAQIENSAGEVIDYREKDGRIILNVMVNGVFGDFVLDLSGHNAILPNCIAKYNISTDKEEFMSGYTTYLFKQVPVSKVCLVDNICFGNNVAGADVKFFILKEESYLAELGVDGVINAEIFANVVLTIDRKRKKITTTAPFRPLYMKLDYRTAMDCGQTQSVNFDVALDGVAYNVLLDTWNKGVVTLNSSDYSKFSANKPLSKGALMSVGYGKDMVAERQSKGDFSFIKSTIDAIDVAENSTLKKSVAGLDLLDFGVVSIDFSKAKIYFQSHDLVAIDDSSLKPKDVVITDGKMNPITRDYFVNAIYDYKKGGEFISKSDKPIVIDFWATWCGPCMKMMPEMEALAKKYEGKVIFMKVNADKEKELCNAFGVKALPTVFLIPAGGKPIVEIGALPEKFLSIIEEKLL